MLYFIIIYFLSLFISIWIASECFESLFQSVIRISKLITDTPEAKRYGPMPGWRHVDCFVKDRLELEFPDSAAK